MNLHHINTKTVARIAAVQALYQYTLCSSEGDIDNIVEQITDFYRLEKKYNYSTDEGHQPVKIRPSISYFKLLVKFGIGNIKQIDDLIVKHLTPQWKIATLPVVLLALLRVSIGELLFCPDTPTKIIINEFTNIADDMLNASDVGFVNSILDKIAMSVRKM